MKNLKIAAAVTAALMSTGAFALDQAGTAGAATQLVVAGASAARDTFATEFQNLCQAGTINLYRASPTTAQDFRAYSCTLLNASPVPTALRNTNATVYYRSEGGSVWGPGSIAKGIAIKKLTVDATCTLAAPPSFGDCAATYSLATEAGTAHLANAATTDLGVSDLEPAMFRGENWVGGPLGAEPAPGVLEALTKSIGFGQTFGLLVNTSISASSITTQDAASILSGAYSNWSQVRDGSGNPLPAAPIVVCRREPGSGTQVGAGVEFLNQNCGIASEPFVTAPTGPNGNTVIERGTTTDLEVCVSTNPGAIGPNIFKTSGLQASTKYLGLDGVAPAKTAAADGTYKYWFESAFAKRPGLSGNASSLADLLISRARAVAGIPGTSASAFAVPGIQGNVPSLPVATSGTPVAVGTKFGNSCKVAIGGL